MAVPIYSELFNPTLSAIRQLGGSASNQELSDAVSQLLSLSDGDLDEEIRPGKSLFENRLGWARTHLKKYGLIDNSERSVWFWCWRFYLYQTSAQFVKDQGIIPVEGHTGYRNGFAFESVACV